MLGVTDMVLRVQVMAVQVTLVVLQTMFML
jgi:hypothetical protein